MDNRIFRVDYHWDDESKSTIVESRNIDGEIILSEPVKGTSADATRIYNEHLKAVKKTTKTLEMLDSRGIWLKGSRERIVRTVRKDTVTGRYFIVWYGSLIEVKYGQRGGGWIDYTSVEAY